MLPFVDTLIVASVVEALVSTKVDVLDLTIVLPLALGENLMLDLIVANIGIFVILIQSNVLVE
jgi:hypothetical protein